MMVEMCPSCSGEVSNDFERLVCVAMKQSKILLAITVATFFGFGCGDDSSSEQKTDDAGKTMVDSGQQSSDAAVDATVKDSSMSMTEVECGTETCTVTGTLATFAKPCCASASTSTCGTVTTGSTTCVAVVEPDPRCENLNLPGGIVVPSCCTTDGRCGFDAATFGMPGCVSIEDAVAQSMMMDAGMVDAAGVDIPEPRACDGEDGGTDDAGQ
jgi:hypothetical protein